MVVGIAKFDNAEISINSHDKLCVEVTLKSVVILTLCFIKDDDKFYAQVLLEEALVA